MNEDKDPNASIGSRSIIPLPSVEDPEETFQIPTEKSNAQDPERRLKEFRARHIQMMALGTFKSDISILTILGSAIGAGLLYQSGKVLYLGGPVSVWLAYLTMGTVLYAVLVSLPYRV
jgi:amino acid permease